MKNNEFERYLKLLGIKASEPTLEALTSIVRAHLTKIPFENISKLYHFKTNDRANVMKLSHYLYGIEKYHFGGTCYSNNYHLYQLLNYLNYDVKLCGADMSRPDVHIVNIVRLGPEEYIVDVGYAAPFLKPLPRNLSEDYSISFGNDTYLLKPQDSSGRSRLELHREGSMRHGCLVNPSPRKIEEFSRSIADSFTPGATFMNAILLVRFGISCSYVIHNMEFIETNGASSKKQLINTHEELVEVIHYLFGIQTAITRIALEDISFQGNAWS